MNPPTTRGVMPMYKESRAITARLNQTVQEWILNNTGGEIDAAVGRQDAHCEAAEATQLEESTFEIYATEERARSGFENR
jgi:hypothetical protein